MGSWREAAAAALSESNAPAALGVEDFGLPDDLADALRRFERMPPPRKLERPQNWAGVVADAMTLARDRWAEKALALGWSAGDLFGVGARTDWDFQGLAAWLEGRRIILLDEKQAIVAGDARDYRSAFIRGGMRHGIQPAVAPVMLWEFGR